MSRSTHRGFLLFEILLPLQTVLLNLCLSFLLCLFQPPVLPFGKRKMLTSQQLSSLLGINLHTVVWVISSPLEWSWERSGIAQLEPDKRSHFSPTLGIVSVAKEKSSCCFKPNTEPEYESNPVPL